MWVLRPESRCVNVRMSLHQVFYQLKTPDCSLASVLSSCSVFQREMALAACSALIPHLAVLTSSGINSLTLRISTQADMVIKNQTFVKVFRISSSISSVPFDKGVVSVSVLALRWSTRLAPEAGSSLSATWTSWTALWSPSSMEVALVCRRLPWTWSSSSTSHTPSNAHADHDTLKVLKKKTNPLNRRWFSTERGAGDCSGKGGFAQSDTQPVAEDEQPLAQTFPLWGGDVFWRDVNW